MAHPDTIVERIDSRKKAEKCPRVRWKFVPQKRGSSELLTYLSVEQYLAAGVEFLGLSLVETLEEGHASVIWKLASWALEVCC